MEPIKGTDDVQRVEAERLDGTESANAKTGFGRPGESGQPGQPGAGGFTFRFGKFGAGAEGLAPEGFASGAPGKAPKIAAWICLVLAWLFLGSSLPFTVFLGVPFALAAMVLAAACLARGATATGVAVLALGSVGSFAVYLVGLFRFLAF